MISRNADPERLKLYARRAFDHLGGAMTAAMVALGDRLGLYRALADGRPRSPADLASETGLSERWVREWLHQQGAAGLLEHRGGGRFALSPEGAAVLADEDHPAFGAGFFAQLPALLRVVERLPEAFRTGRGLPYDALGPDGAEGIERGLAPWFRNLLIPVVLPRLPGVPEALERGIAVADIGCGAGAVLATLAQAFPRSEFHGYDISRHALERAEAKRTELGLSNLHFHHAEADPLPEDGRFGLLLTIDCLHDMAHPDRVIRSLRRALADDGTWLVADIKAHPDYETNVERNPMAAMMYGTSILACLSSALSEPGGMGLGTLGLHPELLEKLCRDAGFRRVERLEVPHPVNAFYRVLP